MLDSLFLLLLYSFSWVLGTNKKTDSGKQLASRHAETHSQTDRLSDSEKERQNDRQKAGSRQAKHQTDGQASIARDTNKATVGDKASEN